MSRCGILTYRVDKFCEGLIFWCYVSSFGKRCIKVVAGYEGLLASILAAPVLKICSSGKHVSKNRTKLCNATFSVGLEPTTLGVRVRLSGEIRLRCSLNRTRDRVISHWISSNDPWVRAISQPACSYLFLSATADNFILYSFYTHHVLELLLPEILLPYLPTVVQLLDQSSII